MLKIMISGRRLPGQELSDFYHELQSTHVDLMKKARCDRFITRYTQNIVIPAVEPLELFASIDDHIDSQASLNFIDQKTMEAFFNDPEYNKIVKPHAFTDSNYLTLDLAEEIKIKVGQVNPNSVKVIYYFKIKPNIQDDQLKKLIEGPYTDLILSKGELISLYLRSYCLPLDPANFLNTGFQKARISQFGVIEELWFDDLDNLKDLHQGLTSKVQHQLKDYIDFKNSFSLLVHDKVIFGTGPDV